MKFIIERTRDGRVLPGFPLTVNVTEQPRTDFEGDCDCKVVYLVAPESVERIVAAKYSTNLQDGQDACVCSCLGRPVPRLKLTRPIAFLDIESTGVDVVTDRIIEFAVSVLSPDGARRRWSQRFDPEMPIPPESTEIHGITDEAVRGKPKFAEFAAKIAAGLSGKDLGGYNLRRMDLPMLDEHFRRCDIRFPFEDAVIIDTFGIFTKKHPRKLEDAVRIYCGRQHAGAHGALADADASADVLLGQLEAHEDLVGMSLAELADFGLYGDNKPCDLAGKLYFDDEGFVRYAFGKAKDIRVADDPGFGSWILRQDRPPFPSSTCDALRAELTRLSLR